MLEEENCGNKLASQMHVSAWEVEEWNKKSSDFWVWSIYSAYTRVLLKGSNKMFVKTVLYN